MSDFLFAQPSTLAGVARTLDLGGELDDYNRSLTPEQADRLALLADWLAVGKDLREAIRQFERLREAERK